ncbi:MAG: hypothetical protein ACK47W_07810 [Bacteroidota bacterium]|jgi:hypothetical protein
MKSLAIILLPIHLMAALLGSNEPSELSKIGNLISHYQHHVMQHGQPNLSFIDFLVDHFGSDQAADDEHEALPLLGGCSATFLAAEIESVRIDLRPSRADVPQSPLPKTNGMPQASVPEIFQPPRLS